MGETDNLVGHIVQSLRGRDVGKSYLVWQEIDKDFVLLVDGDAKKFANPKKKRKKHIVDTNIVIENLKTKILEKTKIFDAEVYSNIRKQVNFANQD